MATSDEELGKRNISWDEYIETSGFIGKLLAKRTSDMDGPKHAVININGRVLLILETGEYVEEWDVTANANAKE